MLTVLALTLVFASSARAIEGSPQGYDIVVIGGQSNAVGAGRGEYHDAFKSEALDQRIFQLGRNIGDCASDEGRIIPATETLRHWLNCPQSKTVGFGMAFARRWAASPLSEGRRVLILPGAYGGTTIRQWQESLWPALRKNLRSLKTLAPGTNRIVAFLWSQGESDFAYCAFNLSLENCVYEKTQPLSDQWARRMISIFQEFRREFDPGAQVPILATGFVPDFEDLRFDKDPKSPCQSSDGKKLDDPNCFASISVRDEKRVFEARLLTLQTSQELKNFIYVSTSGITSNREEGSSLLPAELPLHYTEGTIHFGAQGMVNLGDRMWNAWLLNRTPDAPKSRPSTSNLNSEH